MILSCSELLNKPYKPLGIHYINGQKNYGMLYSIGERVFKREAFIAEPRFQKLCARVSALWLCFAAGRPPLIILSQNCI